VPTAPHNLLIMSIKKRKNRYILRSHLTEAQIRSIVKHFAADLSASDTARLTGINRNTINRIYMHMRTLMMEACNKESPFIGEVEADESYFGPRRVPGKRGRGAAGKTIVFGLLKRDGKVYTEIVPNAQKTTLQAIIRGRVALGAVIYTDSWRGYDGLVDVGYGKHLRVRHGRDEFVDPMNSANHINGIESFWSYAKRRLHKFNGINKRMFDLYLKETEYRFNHRNVDLYLNLLKLLRSSLN